MTKTQYVEWDLNDLNNGGKSKQNTPTSRIPQQGRLAWILQNRMWQLRHPADMATTVAALPAKNWPWQPCTGF